MNQTRLMTLMMMTPTKISISSQGSDCRILQLRTTTIQISDLANLEAPWNPLLGTFSSSHPQFNHQLPTVQDKVVLQRFYPSLWIEAAIKFHVEMHDEQGYNCPQFEHRQGLACTVCWAYGKGYEGASVQHNLLRIESLRNPSIWPEFVRVRREIPRITMQNVRRYLDVSTLSDVARRCVRCESCEARLDRTEYLSACLSYLSWVHVVVSSGREAGDAELHFCVTMQKDSVPSLTELNENAHYCI